MIYRLPAAKTSRGQPTMVKRAEVGIMLLMGVMMRRIIIISELKKRKAREPDSSNRIYR